MRMNLSFKAMSLTAIYCTAWLVAVCTLLFLAALARMADIEADINRYAKSIRTIAEHIHAKLLEDDNYRSFPVDKRLEEIRPVVDYVVSQCINLVPEKHREFSLEELYKSLPEICSKD